MLLVGAPPVLWSTYWGPSFPAWGGTGRSRPFSLQTKKLSLGRSSCSELEEPEAAPSGKFQTPFRPGALGGPLLSSVSPGKGKQARVA